MILERVICVAIGYLFGLFQTSYLYGRANHMDIREHGSGNAGTTNALRTMGKKAGALTLLGDCLKCVLAIWVVRILYRGDHADILPLLSMYAGAGCILGHNFPIYLNFRGGKGVAASVGLARVCDLRCGVFYALFYHTLRFSVFYQRLFGCADCYEHLWLAGLLWYGNSAGVGDGWSACLSDCIGDLST